MVLFTSRGDLGKCAAGCFCSYENRHPVRLRNVGIVGMLAVTSPFAAATLSVSSVFPPFFILIFHTHFLSHSRRLNPRLLNAWQSWTVLCSRVIYVCAPWNRNLCSNPEFLFYLHGNAAPSSSCPTLLRIISHPFMKLRHAMYRVSAWKGSAPVNIMIM